MNRARLANKLAKSLRGQSRQSAYAIKHRALLELRLRFPRRVQLIDDSDAPHLVIVNVPNHHFALHAPAQLFERMQKLAAVATTV